MIQKFFSGVFQSLLAVLIFFMLLEGVFSAAGFPRGATRFIESIVINQKLGTRKPKGEYRIFTYGESTMHGSHYAPVSNLPLWLGAYLHDFLPGRNIRIVNFARMGQSAHFIYESFRDTVDYKPDLVIFYLGHNGFLPNNRKWEIEAKERKFTNRLRSFTQKSRFISAIYRGVIAGRIRMKKDALQDRIERQKIETPLGSVLGPENAIPRTDPRYGEIIAYFREQVDHILKLAEEKKIPVVFFKPVGNLKDFEPYGSTHLKPLSSDDLAAWEEAYEKGRKAQARQNGEEALSFYKQAYQIDGSYADLSFRMGQLYLRQGDLKEAKRLFVEARDNDTIIVRATSDIENVFPELQKRRKFLLLETEKILSPEAPGGILGEPVVEDNVHFSIKGHALLGRALAEEIYKQAWIAPKEEWNFSRARSFEEISKALGVTPDLLFSADIKMVNYFGSRVDNRLRFAQKALEIHPEDPTALRHLAWTYWWMQKRPEAIEVYQKLSRISPQVLNEVFENQPEIKKAFESEAE